MIAAFALVTPTMGVAQSDTAEPTAPAPAPGGCVLTGSPSVFVEGRGMLRLGDVAGCPGIRYEVMPGIFINDQPAVRLIPDDDCAPAGADSVMTDGGQAGVAGSGC